MYTSNSVVPMHPKGQRPERRLAQPKQSRRLNIEKESKAAAKRLPTILFRKYDGQIVVKLSEFTLERLADGVDISLRERQAELQLNLLDVLDRDGLVDPGVIRRRADRLQIIERAVELCVESDDIDCYAKRCKVVLQLPAKQVKQQKRALRDHEQARQAKHQERTA